MINYIAELMLPLGGFSLNEGFVAVRGIIEAVQFIGLVGGILCLAVVEDNDRRAYLKTQAQVQVQLLNWNGIMLMNLHMTKGLRRTMATKSRGSEGPEKRPKTDEEKAYDKRVRKNGILKQEFNKRRQYKAWVRVGKKIRALYRVGESSKVAPLLAQASRYETAMGPAFKKYMREKRKLILLKDELVSKASQPTA